jgi:hypothetical protein
MAEEFLNRSDVVMRFQQMSDKRMTLRLGADVDARVLGGATFGRLKIVPFLEAMSILPGQ